MKVFNIKFLTLILKGCKVCDPRVDLLKSFNTVSGLRDIFKDAFYIYEKLNLLLEPLYLQFEVNSVHCFKVPHKLFDQLDLMIFGQYLFDLFRHSLNGFDLLQDTITKFLLNKVRPQLFICLFDLFCKFFGTLKGPHKFMVITYFNLLLLLLIELVLEEPISLDTPKLTFMPSVENFVNFRTLD